MSSSKGFLIFGIFLLFFFSTFSMAEADKVSDKYKIYGSVIKQDEKIFIAQHIGYSLFEPSDEHFASDSMIYGDIVNVSEDTAYYIIVRGNVYKDGELWEKTGYGQKYTFRHNYSPEQGNPTELAISPYKMTLKPGEAAPFSLWPGQSGWDCYEIWIESYHLENPIEGITDELLRNDLVITQGKLDNKGTFKGKVENPTENAVKNSFVILVKYDDENNIFAIKGDSLGTISPDSSRSFSIPTYLSGMPIKTHTDNFLYGKPAHVEVLAWGYEDDRSQIRTTYGYPGDLLLFSESLYYPDKKLPYYMNLEEMKSMASQEIQKPSISNFCSASNENKGDTLQNISSNELSPQSQIPDWVKNNAKWWADGQVDDSTFTQGIGFLIKEKIIGIASLPEQASDVAEQKVPDWIKNNAGWWADGMITEDDFIKGIKYLVESGIIKVD